MQVSSFQKEVREKIKTNNRYCSPAVNLANKIHVGRWLTLFSMIESIPENEFSMQTLLKVTREKGRINRYMCALRLALANKINFAHCGAVGCVVGWSSVVPEFQQLYADHPNEDYEVFFEEIFGLSCDEVNLLFFSFLGRNKQEVAEDIHWFLKQLPESRFCTENCE